MTSLYLTQKAFIETLRALIEKERATIRSARFPESSGQIPVVRIDPRGHRLSGPITRFIQYAERRVATHACQYQRVRVEWEVSE